MVLFWTLKSTVNIQNGQVAVQKNVTKLRPKLSKNKFVSLKIMGVALVFLFVEFMVSNNDCLWTLDFCQFFHLLNPKIFSGIICSMNSNSANSAPFFVHIPAENMSVWWLMTKQPQKYVGREGFSSIILTYTAAHNA